MLKLIKLEWQKNNMQSICELQSFWRCFSAYLILIYVRVSISSLSMKSSFVIVSISFIALFIGMKMKSSKATNIASFILIFLIQANIGDFSLAVNVVFSAILTAVSFAFAVRSVLMQKQEICCKVKKVNEKQDFKVEAISEINVNLELWELKCRCICR